MIREEHVYARGRGCVWSISLPLRRRGRDEERDGLTRAGVFRGDAGSGMREGRPAFDAQHAVAVDRDGHVLGLDPGRGEADLEGLAILSEPEVRLRLSDERVVTWRVRFPDHVDYISAQELAHRHVWVGSQRGEPAAAALGAWQTADEQHFKLKMGVRRHGFVTV